MTKFVNLCQHTINMNDGTKYEPSGIVARVSAEITPFDKNGIARQKLGDIQDLPAPQDDVYYIVSGQIGNANRGRRKDLVQPATGHPDCKRVNGQVVSVPGFILCD